MKKKVVVAVVAALTFGLVIGGVIGHAATSTTSASTNNPPTIAQLLTLVNAERAKNGAAPLAEDLRLDASAQWKANDEVARGYFGHVAPGEKAVNGLEIANATGIKCVYVSENLRENGDVNTSKAAVDGWISSPPHHAAMIDAKYTLTGFGINGKELVEHFCQQ